MKAMTEEQSRRIEIFFYGLFMDEALLRAKGIQPESRRVALVEDFRLVIGERATLLPCAGESVYGVLYTLTHAEVDALYGEASVSAYRPEAVSAQPLDGSAAVAALCFNLPAPPAPSERNPQYVLKLRELAQSIGLPEEYVSSIR